MQRKIFNNLLQVVALYLIFCVFPNILFAGMPNLKLPFKGGLTWNVTRAYNTASHKDYGFAWFDHRYALDFTDAGCNSWDNPVLAVANGKIIEAHNIDDNGFGKYIVIDHGDGYRTKYSHLNSVSVQVGDNVFQGQEIGKLGNSGNVSGLACKEHPGAHLDFALYKDGKACKPEPMSGYTDFIAGTWYTSDNYIFPIGRFADGYHTDGTSQAFAKCFYDNGGEKVFGLPFDNGKGRYAQVILGNGITEPLLYGQYYKYCDHEYMFCYNPYA